MTGRNLVNILWISDLHFFEEYSEGEVGTKLNDFIDRFIQEVKSEHLSHNIQFVILTGDLAMRGCKSDYDCLFNMFLKKLLDAFLKIEDESHIEIPKVLVIPGNHDVNWSNSNFMRKFLDRIDSGIGNLDERTEFLRNNVDKFEELFQDYTDFINELANDVNFKVYNRFFQLDDQESFIVYKDYKKHWLFGFIVDKKRQTVIFLLNSAWYSIGDNFNKLLAAQKTFEKGLILNSVKLNQWKNDEPLAFKTAENFFLGKGNVAPSFGSEIEKADVPGINEIYSLLNSILKIKDNISEYSKQVSGLNLLQSKDISDILNRFNDYLIITCMHHPLNWLNLEEQYPANNVADNSASNNLNLILSKSDLFLSGHEHLPYRHLKTIKVHETIHLKSGCFLPDNQTSKVRLDGNWFSFLRVDTNKRRLEQVVCRYEYTDGNAGHWVHDYSSPVNFNSRKFRLVKEREGEIYALAKGDIEKKLSLYLKSMKIDEGSTVPIGFINTFEDVCKVYSIDSQDCQQLYIFGIKDDFYSHITNPQFFRFLDKVLQAQESKTKIIRFVLLDLFVDNKLSFLYTKEPCFRDIIRDIIYQRADMLFDNFRHEFFIRFENELLPLQLLKSYKDFSFANHIIQHWDFQMKFS